MYWIILLCLAPAVLGTKVDYYHLLSAKTLEPPASISISNESLFGFSTTYDLYNKRLIISAPRTDDIGDVFDCDLKEINKNSCVKIIRNITREISPNYDHGYWFGATVKSGSNFITACAPRYTINHGKYGVAGTYGRCYQRKTNETSFTTVITRSTQTAVEDYAERQMDTLGWSLDIEKDDNNLIGGFAMYNTRGLAMLALKKNNKKILFDDLPPKVFGNVLNYGYSVAAGFFINPTEISYAVSTTYGSFGMGQVYFFNLPKYDQKHIKYNFELTTEMDEKKIGSMFGAVMCAAKLNPLGIGSDLLVGAPTFSDNKDSGDHNTGAVYVYGFSKKGNRPKFVRQITGNAVGSCFGSAIVSLGDLNGDKRDEIAIGAPYEGNGVVYVYSGADIFGHNTTLQFLQKIESPGYRSFGYSLAALQDYDENGCNELAISAPEDNVVKLYKCIAAITLSKLTAAFPPLKNRTKTGQEDFEFEVCMKFEYPLKPETIFAELSTEVQLKHHHAVLKNPNKDKAYNFNITLDGATSGTSPLPSKHCHNVSFILPKGKDYTMAIVYEIKTTLLSNTVNMTQIDSKHVILSDNSQLTASGPVFAAECKEEECKTNLSMTITANVNRSQPLITGSIEDGNYTIIVRNTGEVAYDPCIQFHVSGANLNVQPLGCTIQEDLENTWKCSSRSPVTINASWELSGMVLDFAALTDEIKTVDVAVKLFNRCNDENPHATDEYSVTLEPDYESIRVYGFTDIGNNVKLTQEDIKVGKQFQHKYKIFNNGTTNFTNLEATVELKKPDFIIKDPLVLVRKENSNKECKDIVQDGDILRAKCKIAICPRCLVLVIIMMGTDPDVLKYEELKKQVKAVNSTLTLHGISTNASSTLQIWENLVETWVLIVAALVGLLLIIILTVILYKCGCLQRRNKKKLQNLKNDVKRQTMRRSMMMQRESQMPDRQPVLESMEEVDESATVDKEPIQSEKKG